MQYKSIVMLILKENRDYYQRIVSEGRLLATIEQLEIELKQSHCVTLEEYKKVRQAKSTVQLSNEALEVAVKNLEDMIQLLVSQPAVI